MTLPGRFFIIVLAVALCLSFVDTSRAENFLFTGAVNDGGGKTVEGAEVFIYDSVTIRRPADFITPRTGKDGVFSIRLPRGKYWAVARVRKGDSKYGPLLPGDRHSGEPVEVDPESALEVKMDFTVADIREAAQNRQKTREDYVRLNGRVLDQDGKPVKNAYVFARGGESGEMPAYISCWTGDRGEYVLFLPRGKHAVRGSLQFPPEPKADGEVSVEVVQKETAADIVLPVGESISHTEAGHGDKDAD